MKTLSKRPAQLAGHLEFPFPVDSYEHLTDALAALRREAEAEIERLIALVDEIEGAADEREADADDELDLGRTEAGYSFGGSSDREMEYATTEDEDAFSEHVAPPLWDWHDGAEQDDSDREPEEDDDRSDLEPSLGWAETGQFGGPDDLEACSPVVTPAARRRYRSGARWKAPVDGFHVDVFEKNELENLTRRQRKLLRPRLRRSAVSI